MKLPMKLEEAIESVLACPRCGGELRLANEGATCVACAAEYPVRDNILDFLSPLDHKSEP